MKFKAMTAIAALAVSAPALLLADADDDTLIVNGEIEMITKAPAPEHLSGVLDEIVSGWHMRSDETQVMQADDFDNPGMIYTEQALDDWNAVNGTKGKSCASCHGDVEESMKGVRAVYPKWNDSKEKVYTMEMQINDCLTDGMGADAWKNPARNGRDGSSDFRAIARHADERRD